MNYKQCWTYIVVLIVVVLLSLSLFFQYTNIQEIKKTLAYRLESVERVAQDTAKNNQTVIEKAQQPVSAAVLWRPIQEKVKDTVVQVYSQVAAIDLLQPYKTPSQGVVSGSGFFIDQENGYIVTNAHVILQAKAVWIQIPSLGKTIIDVDIVGVAPDRDLALLKLTEQGALIIKQALEEVPVLPLGDSDTIYRSDEVLALGYPLGQMSLKSTTGVVSGRERNFIQISAPINPGNSGGPLVNTKGEVVGINSAGIFEAQNVGYAIPINDLKLVLEDLKKHKLLRKPYLGIFFNNGSQEMVHYLENPLPGGCYINGVIPGSTCAKAGIQPGDMLYEINGYPVDVYAEMQIDGSEDKVSIVDYAARLPLGKPVKGIVYRNGKKILLEEIFDFSPLPAIRKIFPGFESIDYEIFGGMVIMPLTLNHVNLLVQDATGLAQFIENRNQNESKLIVTHVFPNSQTHRVRAINVGSLLETVNGKKVATLEDLRMALKDGFSQKYATFTFKDMVLRTDKEFLLVLDYQKVLAQEPQFSLDYRYPLSQTVQELIKHLKSKNFNSKS